jgi:hypothetical protein
VDEFQLVVCTPHGARYAAPDADLSDEVIAAMPRAGSRRRRCAEDSERCGRHSGIPTCCRAWWHRVWAPWVRSGVCGALPRPAWWYDGWGYIACPGCRQCRARVHLLPCPAQSYWGPR